MCWPRLGLYCYCLCLLISWLLPFVWFGLWVVTSCVYFCIVVNCLVGVFFGVTLSVDLVFAELGGWLC